MTIEEMKVPLTMKVIFVFNILLFLSGAFFDMKLMIVTSVVISVILAVAVNILEGIHTGFERLIDIEMKILKEQLKD